MLQQAYSLVRQEMLLTPAVHLLLNNQVIRPADDSLDTVWILGSRLQLDF